MPVPRGGVHPIGLGACRTLESSAANRPQRPIFHRLLAPWNHHAAANPAKTGLAGADFRYRRPKSDRLLAGVQGQGRQEGRQGGGVLDGQQGRQERRRSRHWLTVTSLQRACFSAPSGRFFLVFDQGHQESVQCRPHARTPSSFREIFLHRLSGFIRPCDQWSGEPTEGVVRRSFNHFSKRNDHDK